MNRFCYNLRKFERFLTIVTKENPNKDIVSNSIYICENYYKYLENDNHLKLFNFWDNE